MPYHERHCALTGIMSNTSRVKSLLKTKLELFQGDNKEHFGKEFWEQIFEILMVHKNSIELLTSTLSQNRFRGGMTFFSSLKTKINHGIRLAAGATQAINTEVEQTTQQALSFK